MKLILSLLILSSALANHFDLLCEKSLRYQNGQTVSDKIELFKGNENNYAIGKKQGTGYFLDITNKSNELTFSSSEKMLPKDLKEYEGKIYILFADRIQVRDSINYNLLHEFATLKSPIANKYQAAWEIEILDDKIYMAHGSEHLVILNRATGKIIDKKKFDVQKKPSHRSILSGIEVYQNKIYMMFDNITYDFGDKTRAFEGMVLADQKTLKTQKIIWLNQKREALHEPSLERDGDVLYSQNLHIIFNYRIDKIEKLRSLNPNRRLYNFNRRALIGKPMVENKTITGCFREYYSDNEKPKVIYSSFSY